MAFKLCSSLQATHKAGKNASTTALGDAALLDGFSNSAEGTFQMKTRKDWSAAFATTAQALLDAISDAVACDIANKIINYDMSGYTSRTEAQTMLSLNKDQYDMIMSDLREDPNQKLNK